MSEFDGEPLEHDHWSGPQYQHGFGSQKDRLAIIGYSHYWQPGEGDSRDFTHVVINQVLSQETNPAFFKQIASYFGEGVDFWNKVVFFNFMPSCIGPEESRFATGSPLDHDAGRQRALRIFELKKPDKVFVFSMKAWQAFPPTDEEKYIEKGTHPLGDSFPPEFRWGTYKIGDHTIRAYGLRHPQGANDELMCGAVQSILSHPG